MIMIILKLETANFEFLSTGKNEIEAREHMRMAIRRHCKDYIHADEAELIRWIDDARVYNTDYSATFRDGERV